MPPAPPASRRRRWPAILAALGLASVLSLVAGELLLRALWTRPPRLVGESFRGSEAFVPDPELGWRARPQLDFVYRLPTGDERRMRTNSRGFRDVEHAHEPTPGRPRVVVLGDSFTEGYGVGNEETFCARLAALLPEAELINLGVTAYDIRQQRRLLELDGLAYGPEVVVLAFFTNDVASAPIAQPSGAARATEGAPPPPERSWKQVAADELHLYDFLSRTAARHKPTARLLTRLGLKDGLAGYEGLADSLRPFLRDYPPQLAADWEAAMGELAAIARACEAVSAELVVAPIPPRESVRPEALPDALLHVDYDPGDFDLDRPFDQLAAAAAEVGARFVDPRPAFRSSRERLYIPYDMHFDPDGHALFARVLEPELRAALRSDGEGAAPSPTR